MWLLRRTKAAHGDGPPTDELSALPCDLLQRTLSFADAATLARLSRCSRLLRRAAAAAAGSKVSRLGSSITIKELLQHQWSELTMRLEHDQEEALADIRTVDPCVLRAFGDTIAKDIAALPLVQGMTPRQTAGMLRVLTLLPRSELSEHAQRVIWFLCTTAESWPDQHVQLVQYRQSNGGEAARLARNLLIQMEPASLRPYARMIADGMDDNVDNDHTFVLTGFDFCSVIVLMHDAFAAHEWDLRLFLDAVGTTMLWTVTRFSHSPVLVTSGLLMAPTACLTAGLLLRRIGGHRGEWIYRHTFFPLAVLTVFPSFTVIDAAFSLWKAAVRPCLRRHALQLR